MLTFDPQPHAYYWNGRRVPSVTQVLEPMFDWSRVPEHILERKRQIGQAVHEAIHLELQGGVDRSSIDPACRPYFDAWCRFRDEKEFEPVLVEYRVYSDEYGEDLAYAGQLDEWGLLTKDQALIDWKCTLFLNTEAVGAQLAAYLCALHRAGIAALSDKRFALKLSREGTYQLVPFRRLHDDMSLFMKCRRRHTHASQH